MLWKSTASLIFKAFCVKANKSNYKNTVNEAGLMSPPTAYRTFLAVPFRITLPLFQGITSKSLDFDCHDSSFHSFHYDLIRLKEDKLARPCFDGGAA